MRCCLVLIASVGVFAAANVLLNAAAHAQPALDRLERELKPRDPAPPGTAPTSSETGYFGVVAEERKDNGPGVRVLKTTSGSPAAQANIQAGDLLIAIDDQPILRLDDLEAGLKGHKPGERVQFTIERNKSAELRNVVLSRPPARRLQGDHAPDAPGPATNNDPNTAAPNPPDELERPRRLGIRTVAITDEIRQLYDLPSTRGALVSEVLVGSPAHAAGIPLDAAIVEANGQVVLSPDSLAGLVAAATPGKDLTLAYYSRGQLQRKTLRLEGNEVAAKPVAPAAAPMPDTVRDFMARLEILEARIRQLEKELYEVQTRVPPAEKNVPAPAPQ